MTALPSSWIADCCAAVDDPGVDRCQRHQALDIITTARCGVMCGADGWADRRRCIDGRWPESRTSHLRRHA